MKEFNQFYIINEIEKNYHKTFTKKRIKVKTTVISYGFKNDKTGNVVSMFFCFNPDIDPNNNLIGFAVHYGFKKILRFYNHEGEDIGLEFNMVFKLLKKRVEPKTKKRKKH